MRRPPLRFQLSPSFVLASLALFFALGGSAFAFRAASVSSDEALASAALPGLPRKRMSKP